MKAKIANEQAQEEPSIEPQVETIELVDEKPSAEAISEARKAQEEQKEQKIEQEKSDDEKAEEQKTKIKLKLGKLGKIFSESEQWVYEHWGLNKLMREEEIAAEKKEVEDDTALMIDLRLKILSEWGDILNIGLDFGSHVITRIARAKQHPEMKFAPEYNQPNGAQQRYNDRDHNPDGSLSAEKFRQLTSH